jgi:hypothetical protein
MTKEQFLDNPNAYGSHRNLLWEALEATKHLKLPVIELGSGQSSTPYIRQYCKDEGLEFFTYESSRKWAETMGSEYVEDWDKMNFWDKEFSVCLLDLAPGEYRKVALMKLINTKVICVHDSEAPGWNASDYRIRPLFSKFKYMLDDIPNVKGAPWTTLVSNEIDVTKFEI